MDYTVIGHAVNVAARLENACAPGAILVSAATYEHVRDEFPATSAGHLTLKGPPARHGRAIAAQRASCH